MELGHFLIKFLLNIFFSFLQLLYFLFGAPASHAQGTLWGPMVESGLAVCAHDIAAFSPKHHLSGSRSSPGFPDSFARTGLSYPREGHFNQAPCLCLSWPLLSLSESVSIAGDPCSHTSRHFAPSPAESSQRAGLPLFIRKTNRSPGS